MKNRVLSPNYLFETSWEVCNKVGGINTVVSTKALVLHEEYQDNLILIGPDVWRETKENPDFNEDPDLLKSWREAAAKDGLRIRIGRTTTMGNPIAVLIDFSAFVQQKDELFKIFWETYRLDSISGQRDYVEAAVFGYAAGKVIEHFYSYNLTIRDKVVAHFHEWMTGTGILYLKKNTPQIATLFTTHATVIGRSVAGNGMSLYDRLHEYNGDVMARELNVVAKQSLEKVSAQQADCFTTVSEITSRECEQFLEKKPDVITPNGFEDNFVPQGDKFEEARERARHRLREVASTMFGYELPADTVFVANSGRYEFSNKGIDVFISSMGEANKNKELNKDVVALVLVPANNYGPRKDIQDALENKDSDSVNREADNCFLTHGLHDSEYDPILNEIKSTGLKNEKKDHVKIIYSPCYLNGKDGIFNLSYYDLLIGMDLTIFPSYYEPWGYTPLESLAFHVPTVTTNLAGIGMWVNSELVQVNEGIEVFERGVGKDPALIQRIVDKLIAWSHKSIYDIRRARENAYTISRIALWKNLIKYYKTAYSIALLKVEKRSDQFHQTIKTEHLVTHKVPKTNKPRWKSVTVQPYLPDMYKGLSDLSMNLWWSWNFEAGELFEYIDNELWESCDRNPIWLLKEVSYERLKELEEDQQFLSLYTMVYKRFKDYMNTKPDADLPKLAYFSMEYGLINNLKIYSGGLGILAGDYLKEASDTHYDMVAVGFLYKHGYFTQQLSVHGEQMVYYDPQDFSNLPIHPITDTHGNYLTVQVAFPGRIVYARIWRVDVGRVRLYLLDTDIDLNTPEDRSISHQLYGGDNEHRLKQEMLLGIGGIRVLDELGIDQDIFHCNEGHAAFIGLERLHRLINDLNLTFAESLEIVRASTLFTTHTPVPAGHDAFSQDLIMVYMGHYPQRLKISWEEFVNLGISDPNNKQEKFSMSNLAANLSQEINGVSMLHGEVTKNMFNNLWPGYFPEELHIGYVTNGIHGLSWIAKDWNMLYRKEFGKEMFADMSNKKYWSKIYQVSSEKIWNLRNQHRKMLIDFVKNRISQSWIKRHEDPKRIVEIKNILSEDTLTVGFARRFATYKRAHLLFKNIDRLAKLVNNPEMPIQFLFAGKAHPADKAGQDLIKMIVEVSKRPEFLGKIVFLQNYDIELAKRLVQGVDVWLNTPTRPLEASGTSGMKAVINGALNFSVLDGWWVEGYQEHAGWALPLERTFDNQEFQDDLDAETIYAMFEQELTPTFYKRDEDGIPQGWIDHVKNSIANIAPEFTTKRMIDDYRDRFYLKQYERTLKMRENDYELAKRIATWKKKMYRGWESLDVVSINFPDTTVEQLVLGKSYPSDIILDLKDLGDVELGVEMVISEMTANNETKIIDIKPMDLMKREGTRCYYHIDVVPSKPGVLNYGLRVYPKNEDLPHRQDFPFVRWI